MGPSLTTTSALQHLQWPPCVSCRRRVCSLSSILTRKSTRSTNGGSPSCLHPEALLEEPDPKHRCVMKQAFYVWPSFQAGKILATQAAGNWLLTALQQKLEFLSLEQDLFGSQRVHIP